MPLPLLPNNGTDEPSVPIGLDLEVVLGRLIGSPGTVPGEYPDPDDAPGWTMRVVDMFGEVLGPLPNANPGQITKTLGQPDAVTFTSPKYDPATAIIEKIKTDVQVFRNDDLKTWCVVTGHNAG